MSRSFWRVGHFGSALLDLTACFAGFGLAALLDNQLTSATLPSAPEKLEPNFVPWVLSPLIAWLALLFPESQWHEGVRLWIDSFLSVIGTNLLVQCGLIYLFGIQPAPWFTIIVGSIFSIAGVAALRTLSKRGTRHTPKALLLAGSDELTVALAYTLRNRLIGLVGNPLPVTGPALDFLGGIEQVDEVCARVQPSLLVVGAVPNPLPLPRLLQLHYSGITMESAPSLYERVSHRVAWQHLAPADLLFFLNPNTSRLMLAFQAIYKNLLGLALRLLSAPFLLLFSFLIALSTGGPPIEYVDCLGYQRMPFQLRRFRIRRTDGSMSLIGKLIDKLHLTNLPQLINVVRGEMSLFGPAPVRTVFAERLIELLPAYVYRFTVKPGILGWAQVEIAGLPDEISRMECDFYYIKQESPSLDLNILLHLLSRPSPGKKTAAGVASPKETVS
jgi:lipopolysaccharide/colanic/teichoic acid biosynthesis glycosyltransferase